MNIFVCFLVIVIFVFLVQVGLFVQVVELVKLVLVIVIVCIVSYIIIVDGVQLYYKDWGLKDGLVVIFSYGWLLNLDSWELQMIFLVNYGYCVIVYDCCGYGCFSQLWDGNDMDYYVDDLVMVINMLDLYDVILVGFFIGGGEVVCYIGWYGIGWVKKVVLISLVLLFMLKIVDNLNGLLIEVFDGICKVQMENCVQLYCDILLGLFYGFNCFGVKVLQGLIDVWWVQGMQGGYKNIYDLIVVFLVIDFCVDLKKFDVFMLVIYGDDDQIVLIDIFGCQLVKFIKGVRFIVYLGVLYGLIDIYKDRVNQDLLMFLQEK